MMSMLPHYLESLLRVLDAEEIFRRSGGEFRNRAMRVIARLEETVWAQWDEVAHAAAVIGTVLCVGATVLFSFANLLRLSQSPASTFNHPR